jgi:ferric-dicitrate binding protein FerR (iron transport regulator)
MEEEMKRNILVVFLITVIVSAAFGQNGVLRELSGEVELKHAGASSFVAASAGNVVALNTIISTGFRSSAVIAVGSSVIIVRPLTRLTLAEIQSAENAENVNVNLQAGRVRVEVKPPAGTRANFTVQSPSSTASVRGTIFEADVQNVKNIEGKTLVSGTSGTAVMLTGGNSSSLNVNGTFSNPSDNAESSVQLVMMEGMMDLGSSSAPAAGINIDITYPNN